jgi:hypothetical protein
MLPNFDVSDFSGLVPDVEEVGNESGELAEEVEDEEGLWSRSWHRLHLIIFKICHYSLYREQIFCKIKLFALIFRVTNGAIVKWNVTH